MGGGSYPAKGPSISGRNKPHFSGLNVESLSRESLADDRGVYYVTPDCSTPPEVSGRSSGEGRDRGRTGGDPQQVFTGRVVTGRTPTLRVTKDVTRC